MVNDVFDQKLHGTEGNGAGAPGNLALIAQIQEILADVVIGQLVGGAMIVLGKQVDGLEIGPLGMSGQTPELHGRDHPLA